MKKWFSDFSLYAYAGIVFFFLILKFSTGEGTLNATLLTVLTATLAYYTYSLVKDSKDTSKRELRAYISATATYIGFEDSKNMPDGTLCKPNEMRLTLENHGQTPAYNVRTTGVFDILPVNFPEDFVFPEIPKPQKNTHTINPKQVFISSRPRCREFTNAEIDAACSLDSNLGFCFYGVTEYETIWKETQTSKFCYFAAKGASLISLRNGVKDENGGTKSVALNFYMASIHNDSN